MTQIKATYLDHMGDDLKVVNSARVSFNKTSEWHVPDWNGFAPKANATNRTFSDQDTKLVNYLAKHKHTSPFGHCFASFHVKAPIFVARQLVKHKFLRWNEVSRRYVDDEPEFYQPEVWRKRPDGSVKQGSGTDVITDLRPLGFKTQTVDEGVGRFNEYSLDLYKDMLDAGIAPEMARMVLPQNIMTEWYWSGSLDAFADMCKLRLDPHAQYETRIVAEQIDKEMSSLFPISWAALLS